MEEIITLIGNFGFPIAVASYLLLRFEKTINTLACDIRNLKEEISNLEDMIKK
jgi:hypothetical protein